MNKAPRCWRAFTLIELLVSISILTLLVVFVTSMVNAVNKIWSAGEQRVEIYQNGRAILDQVARDLAPASTSQSLQTAQNVDATSLLTGSNTVSVMNSDNLFWQTTENSNSYGNVFEVGYILVKTTNTRPVHYQLKRFYAAPDTRYPTPSSTPLPSGRIFQIYDAPFNAVTVPWLTNMSTANFQNSLTTLSEGVLDLWVRFLDRNGDPVPWLKSAPSYSAAAGTMKFNSAAAFSAAVPGTSNSFQYAELTDVTGAAVSAASKSMVAVNAANRLPTSVELTVITLDAKSFQRSNITVPDPPASTLPGDVPTTIDNYLNMLLAQKLTGAQLFSRTVRLQDGTD